MIPAFISILSGITLTLMHSIWQALILWLLYITVIQGIGNAKSRFNVALALLTFQVLLSIATFVFFTGAEITPFGSVVGKGVSMPTFFYVTNLLGAIYILFQCFKLYKLHNSRHSLKRFISASQMTALPQWRMYVAEHARKLNIPNTVRVYLSRTLQSPVTIGFFKPVILLPLSMVNGLTPRQIEAVLLHELAHISRNDYLLNIFLQALQQLFFFNPFIASLLKNCYRERENSCDDIVMQFRYDKVEYSRALLYLHQREMDWSMMGLSNGTDYELLQRIRRMVDEDNTVQASFSFNWKLGSALVISVLMTITPLLIQHNNSEPDSRHEFQRLGLYNYQKGFAWLRAVHINNTETFVWQPSVSKPKMDGGAIRLSALRNNLPAQTAEATSALPLLAMPDLVLNMQPSIAETDHAAVAGIVRVAAHSEVRSNGSEHSQSEEPPRYEGDMESIQKVADEQRLSLDARQYDLNDLKQKLEEKLQQTAEALVYSRSDEDVLQSVITRLLELKAKPGNQSVSRKLGEDMIEAFTRTELARGILQDSRTDYEDLMQHLRSLLVSRSIKL